MKVNTLLLCACGTNVNIIIGYLYALEKKEILKKDYSNIKRFVGCSAGSIIALFMSMGLSLPIIYNLSNKIKYDNLINLNNLNNLFENMGLFDTNNMKKNIECILHNFGYDKNMTLLEFYKKTKKNLIIKTYNLSLNEEIYASYKNYPDIEISTLICMSSAIPFVFKPVMYNNNVYIDGAVCGSMPFIDEYKHYISIIIEDNNPIILDKLTFSRYCSLLIQSTNNKYKDKKFYTNKRNIVIYLDLNMSTVSVDFSANKEKKNKHILIGYEKTMEILSK